MLPGYMSNCQSKKEYVAMADPFCINPGGKYDRYFRNICRVLAVLLTLLIGMYFLGDYTLPTKISMCGLIGLVSVAYIVFFTAMSGWERMSTIGGKAVMPHYVAIPIFALVTGIRNLVLWLG